jgi:hypothetical protein
LENIAVKNERSSNLDHHDTTATGNAWTQFWFAPIPTLGLHCLRVACGSLFLFWLLSLVGHQQAFFSQSGWLDRQALIEIQELERRNRAQQAQFFTQSNTPPMIGWSILYLAGDDQEMFQLLYYGAFTVILLFTLGVATRLTGILTWVAVVSFLSNPEFSYEADCLLGILAFYMMIAYLLVGQWHGNLSLFERILGSRHDFLFARWLFAPAKQGDATSSTATFVLRLLQIHFVIILVTSGLHKLQMGDWWSGAALFYPLHPPLHTSLKTMQSEWGNTATILFVLSLVQYLAVAWQITLPFFAWRRGWCRVLLLGGGICAWIGMMLVFRLPIFGPFILLGCFSFLGPDEWQRMKNWTASLWQAAPESKKASEPQKVAVAAGKTNIKK